MADFNAYGKELEKVVEDIRKYLLDNAEYVYNATNNNQKAIVSNSIYAIYRNSLSDELLKAEYDINALELFERVELKPKEQIRIDSIRLASSFNTIVRKDISVLTNEYFRAFGALDIDVKDIYKVVRDWEKKTGIDPTVMFHQMSTGRKMRLDYYLKLVARSEQNIRNNEYIEAYAKKYGEPFYLVNERTIPTSREGSIAIAGKIISKDSSRLFYTTLDGTKKPAIYEGDTDIGQAGGAFGVNSIRQAFILSDGYSDADPTERPRTEKTPNEIITRAKDMMKYGDVN